MTVLKFSRPQPPTFATVDEEAVYRRGRLAMACRVIAAEGWGIGCSMQLSSRDAKDPDIMYIVPAGRAMAAMRSSYLIPLRITTGELVEDDSSLYGYDLQTAAIHRAIYIARPDINAIIHGQTPNARAFAMQDLKLEMTLQDSCTFHDRIHTLPSSVWTDPIGQFGAIESSLKDGKGLIMQNRGILLVGKSIECPMSYYIRLESLCKAQLLAQAAVRARGGALVIVGKEEVKFTFENNGSEHHAWLMAKPYFARQDRLTGGALVI